MSFSRLPPELKATIVDHSNSADQRYNARLEQRERDTKKIPLGVERGDPRGRTLFALSLVNKELRNICYKHIFEVSSQPFALRLCRAHKVQTVFADSEAAQLAQPLRTQDRVE